MTPTNTTAQTRANMTAVEQRAKWITGMIQGTMALEGHGLMKEDQDRVNAKVKRLLSAPVSASS